MKKEKGRKSNAQLIIGALLTGKTLRSREISDMVLEKEGRKIKVQDVASMLSRISDSKKCDLGSFIQREQEGNGFIYQMVEDALKLTEEQAYDLTLKTGKDRYLLEKALEDFPGLRQHVEPEKSKPKAKSKSKPKPKKTVAKKATKTAPPAKPAKVKTKKAEPAAPVPPPVVEESVDIDKEVEKMAAKLIEKVNEMGGLNLNVKVSLKVEGIEDSDK